MSERATRALVAIDTDDEARVRFLAAYDRPGDPVAALRALLDPDDAAFVARDTDALRRVAFGRTETEAEEADARAARERLAAREAEALADRDALDRAIDAALEAPAHPQPESARGDDDVVESEAREPRRWVLPALAGLVVGAVLAASAVWMLRPADSTADAGLPSSSPTGGINYFLGDPDATGVPGDLAAAESWFDQGQSEEDLVGVGELRPEFDRASVRLVHSSPLARVWVAKQVDGKLCLETTDTESQVTSGSCAISTDFTQRGLSVTSNVLTATWNGAQLSVVLTQRD